MDDRITLTDVGDGSGSSAPAGSTFALVMAYCAHLPARTGECALLAELGTYVLGRGAASRGERPVEFGPHHPLDRREPCELDVDTISRRTLQITRTAMAVHVKLLGRGPMRINGVPATEGRVVAGDVIAIANRLLLCVTIRSLRPRLRFFPAKLLGPPGQPDAFGMVGDSERMMRLRDDAAFAAQGDLHVLVLGESGAGKRAVAQAVHGLSSRAKQPLVVHNAAGLSKELAQAELMGNEKNFPNPPMDPRPGLLGEADGGTLVLDEIGELPHPVQAKLLSVLDDDGRYRRLGGSKTLRSDFRMVGATNQPPEKSRRDFIARFKARVMVPSLREHAEDIPQIAQHRARELLKGAPELAARFIEKRDDGSSWVRIAPDLLEALMLAEHPTNVRGLDEALWAAIGRSTGSRIRASKEQLEGLTAASKHRSSFLLPDGKMRELTPDEVQGLRELFDGSRGSAAKIAAAWGVTRFQIHRALKRYGIEDTRAEEPDDETQRLQAARSIRRSR